MRPELFDLYGAVIEMTSFGLKKQTNHVIARSIADATKQSMQR